MSYGQQGGYGPQQGGYGGHGGYGPQHGMPYGANERGHGWGQGGGGYEGVQAQRGGHGGQYGELLYSPEFAEAVMRVCRERMDGVLAEQGYFPAGMQGAGFAGQGGFDHERHERHKRFKEVLDELRDLPTAEAQRRMPVVFPGLDEEGKRVLSVLVSESSKKKLAQKANIPLERFTQKEYELEGVFKYK